MTYSLDDRAAFLRAERDWLTPRDERVSDDELSEMSREIDAAEARDATLTRLRALRNDPTALHAFVERVKAFVASPDEDALPSVLAEAVAVVQHMQALVAQQGDRVAEVVREVHALRAPCDGCGLPCGAHSDAALARCKAQAPGCLDALAHCAACNGVQS